MAIVKVGQIKTSLNKAIAYITRDDKTQDKYYVTVSWLFPDDPDIRNPSNLAEAMMTDDKNSMAGVKKNTTLARHVIQSFDPKDDVDPVTAHGLGMEFANRITDNGAYKYVIATHIDRNHIHNHIIICNTNGKTHYKMRLDKNTLMKRWTPISDELCQEYGFSVSPRHGQDMKTSQNPTLWLRSGDYYASLRGEGQKQRIRDMIDRACTESKTFTEFSNTLKKYQVEANIRGAHITYTDLATGRKYRDNRLGMAYDESAVMMKLNHQALKHISVNQKLIDYEDPEKIRIIIPHTKGNKRITVPKTMATRTGTTIRIYFGQDTGIPVSDRQGKGMGKMSMRDLYAAFGQPAQTWNDLKDVRRHMPRIELHGSVKQNGWMRNQMRMAGEISRQATALSLIARNGGSANNVIQELTGTLQQADETLTSLMIARQDVISRIALDEDNEDSEIQLFEIDEHMDRLEDTISTLRTRIQAVDESIREHDQRQRPGFSR
ncbi:relaxase/mobilization nuclease domain-containing protein [Bifidobacterium moukalabense]|uniref:relaxase/mobilization nuclease domain-containing protein n=1 Tax=Bifidobacterium moukalabense TaxID=1333651 RepID=UPI0010F50971|nr:relaxase/mobilization nuclease domain-containing protein [Bifidobacterium moukalabense]